MIHEGITSPHSSIPFLMNTLTLMGLTKPSEIEGAVAAADRTVEVHNRLAAWLKAGLTLAHVDAFVAETLSDLKSKSAFIKYKTGHYPPFPSHSCLSPNDVVVHGTAGMSIIPFKPGDIISIDIGVKHRGWIGDAAWTYAIESVSDDARKLCECGKKSILLGIEQLQPGAPLIRWAETVQDFVEGECGFSLVRGLGGHGYGRTLHAPPFISNVRPISRLEWPDANYVLRPGDLIAVEPMIAQGSAELEQHPKRWPIKTADGKLAVHFEHDVLITESGPRVLTAGLNDLPLVVG